MDVDALRIAAGLKPLPASTAEPLAAAKPAIVTEDATIGNEERLRGIPAVGRVSGTIKGTRPGDPSHDLAEAARDIRAANEVLAKAKAERLRQIRADLKRNGSTPR